MLVTAIGAFVGALLSLLASIYIEFQRKPKLHFEIEDPPHDSQPSGGIKEARFLRVLLCNDPMPSFLKWLDRNPAMQCYGDIQFYHLEDGAYIFSRPMPIRWGASDEPLTFQILPDNKTALIFDYAKFNSSFHRNCFPGIKEPIDVAARFDDDEECFGWTSENYLPDKTWRNPEWKLPKGRYLARVAVHSSGETVSAIFQIENTVARKHFHLSHATQDDVLKLTK